MLEGKLEVLVITYNRAAALSRTLEQLRVSPFANCHIQVLDNCSSDHTPAVCERWRLDFPKLSVVRHRRNVGLCANYLRAVELSEGEYTWILCDDDQFDFSNCNDVLAALESGKSDLVCLGAAGPVSFHPGETTTAAELVENGAHFFMICSFVPALIFRTALFDSTSVAAGYRNAANLFPHFDFLRRTVLDKRSIYLAKHRLLIRDESFSDFSDLLYAFGWAASARALPERGLERHVLRELFAGPISAGFVRRLVIWIAADKVRRRESTLLMYWRLGRVLPAEYKLGWLVGMLFALLPPNLFRWLKWRLRKRKGQIGNAEVGSFDPLRF